MIIKKSTQFLLNWVNNVCFVPFLSKNRLPPKNKTKKKLENKLLNHRLAHRCKHYKLMKWAPHSIHFFFLYSLFQLIFSRSILFWDWFIWWFSSNSVPIFSSKEITEQQWKKRRRIAFVFCQAHFYTSKIHLHSNPMLRWKLNNQCLLYFWCFW